MATTSNPSEDESSALLAEVRLDRNIRVKAQAVIAKGVQELQEASDDLLRNLADLQDGKANDPPRLSYYCRPLRSSAKIERTISSSLEPSISRSLQCRESKRGSKTARRHRQRLPIALPPALWFACAYPADRPPQHVWTSISRGFLPATNDRVVRYWPDPFLVSNDDVGPSHYAKWYTHWLTNYEVLNLARSRLVDVIVEVVLEFFQEQRLPLAGLGLALRSFQWTPHSWTSGLPEVKEIPLRIDKYLEMWGLQVEYLVWRTCAQQTQLRDVLNSLGEFDFLRALPNVLPDFDGYILKPRRFGYRLKHLSDPCPQQCWRIDGTDRNWQRSSFPEQVMNSIRNGMAACTAALLLDEPCHLTASVAATCSHTEGPSQPVFMANSETKAVRKKRSANGSILAKLLGDQYSRTFREPRDQPFHTPCYGHGGDCLNGSNRCSCLSSDHFCDSDCECDLSCRNRWRGCSCSSQNDVCDPLSCVCAQWHRECGTACTCSDNSCENKSVTKGINSSSLMCVAPSKIPGAGLGIFAKKPIPWNSYIGEYAGELLTNDDAERRGILYDAMRRNYFFEVASNAVVDAFRIGTLLRFANHQSKGCNLEPRVVMVNGSQRIAFYTIKAIRKAEELVFHYGAFYKL